MGEEEIMALVGEDEIKAMRSVGGSHVSTGLFLRPVLM